MATAHRAQGRGPHGRPGPPRRAPTGPRGQSKGRPQSAPNPATATGCSAGCPHHGPTRAKTAHTARQPKKEEAVSQGKCRGRRPPNFAQRPPAIAQCQTQWERWSKISELLRHLRAGGAVEHLESFINRGHTKNQHDRFLQARVEDQRPPRFWELEPELLCFSPCRRSHRSPGDLEGGYLWRGHRRVDLGSPR